MLNALRRSAGHRKAARELFAEIAARARAPEFFRDLGVPDTFNGRFDMVALHAWLVLERLEAEGARAVSQALVNAIFDGFEDALRDQGAGDMGMSRRVRKIADAFYGRLKAYEAVAGRADLVEALLRNVYGGDETARAAAGRLASYILAARARLAEATPAAGQVAFGPIACEEVRP